MKKSTINPLPLFFDRYINLVEQDDLFEALDKSLQEVDHLDINTFNKIGDKSYQSDKWSIKEIIQHIIDNERIQSYRAMRFARFDKTELPGYDEKLLGLNSKANRRAMTELIAELKTLRTSTIQLFQSFDKSVFDNSGICFKQNVTVSALGFVIVGHQIHHLNVIKEKYLPLAK